MQGIPKKILEKHVRAAIRSYLNLRGVFFWANLTAGLYDPKMGGRRKHPNPGIPDLIALHHGVMVGIEVKRPGGKAKPHQQAFLDMIIERGGRAVVADDVSKVIDIIEQIGAEHGKQ